MAHARKIRGRALLYGADDTLLQTRGQLLLADGYQPDIVANLASFTAFLGSGDLYDIVVLCHTVEQTERDSISLLFENESRHIPVYNMPSAVAPEDFILEVARLTGRSPLMAD